ncbi:MAG: class I SAM-dependent methyltransferase [Candidatus Nanopelagicales bacterium]|nr:class I SAM-dependent methyltransferase [Candidatus Nanopelagicales bacterium]
MEDLHLYPVCPLCHADLLVELGSVDCTHHERYSAPLSPQMHWRRCEQCRHVFRSGYYTDEANEILFRGTNENQVVGFDMLGQRWISARMVDRVLPFQSGGMWLDVGFGNGSLLMTAQEYGFDPIGLDLRQGTVDAMRELGVQAECMDFCSAMLEPKCSVISMADVLEHMPDPRAALESAHRNLVEGGVLLLSMPNMDAPLWHVMDAEGVNPYWSEIEHVHNFGRRRLYELLEEFSFTPVQYGVSERYPVCMEVIALRREPVVTP